ncbi:hypothetical protein M433DRAFT_158853 [Acidomyces richmondensis BFW]|nr:hypothetical protein M433DRAFT_158853 [Acidomyces richmondensis BFW]
MVCLLRCLQRRLRLTFAKQVNFVGRPLYMLGVTGLKIALCFAYLRLTSGTTLKFRKVVWSAMAFIGVAQLTSTFVIIFQCRPVAKSWEPHLPGSFLAIYPTWNATAAITIFCDVVTFLLPIPLFIGLQIRPRQKLGLVILFILGLFTSVCSVMRMVQIKTITKGRKPSLCKAKNEIECLREHPAL